MTSQRFDAFYDREVGPVWRELRGGLWHVTPSHRFKMILADGEIKPSPLLPKGEFQWAESGSTHCRHAGGVSLFDFARADWEAVFKHGHEKYWLPFLQAHSGAPDPHKWLSMVWLAVDRDSLPGFVSADEIDTTRRRNEHLLANKWMPWVEACHKGPIPLSVCTHAVVVCAEERAEFRQFDMRAFSVSELYQLEAEWRHRFAERYEYRRLSFAERLQPCRASYRKDRGEP